MPKMATKAADNVFYKARIAAASWNDRLGSREGASEVTGIDRTRLANIELGTINPHPEEVLMLSDTYNAPELQNHFCSHLCPLGILNVSLNKISGRWDNEKLTAILDELKEQDEMALTGFEDWELDALKVTYDHIEDLLNEDFSDTGKSEPNSYTMTFTLPEEVHEAMDKYIDENPAGKVELAQLLVNKAKGLI